MKPRTGGTGLRGSGGTHDGEGTPVSRTLTSATTLVLLIRAFTLLRAMRASRFLQGNAVPAERQAQSRQ